MIKEISQSLLLCAISLASRAQDDGARYALAPIPDSLKKNAHSVYRLDEGLVEISSPSDFKMSVHQVVTVLDAEGVGHLRHVFGVDPSRSVDNVEIYMYDALGRQVKKYTKKDFAVQAAYDDVSLVTDDKVMHLQTPAPGFPCTYEIRYRISVNAYVDLPDWQMNRRGQSIETLRYTVVVPADLDIRQRAINCDLKPAIEQVDKKKKYSWEAHNIKAVEWQPGGFDAAYYEPGIEVAPNEFEYKRYKGQFRNWEEFGLWSYPFYEEAEPFSKTRTAELKNIAASETTVKGKVRALYNYLKSNTRYVSIQLGIGGFKPFPAKFVDEKKYGDCKALTNYMRHLLKLEGIESYPALINAGYDEAPVDATFPSNQFNHVILCVPNNKDTIWLECTSSENEAGFLGSFTENKNALLLTEKGGRLVRTPSSSYQNNKMRSHTEISLKEDGSAATNTRISATGDLHSLYRQIQQMNADDQKQVLINYLNYRAGDRFAIADQKEAGGLAFSFEFDQLYDFKAGPKYFFGQKLCSLAGKELKKGDRSVDYIFEYPFEKTDTTLYHLPKGFSVDEMPAAREFQTPFSSYTKTANFDASKGDLLVVTTLILKKNVIPPADYKKLTEFFSSVQKDEGEKIILKKE